MKINLFPMEKSDVFFSALTYLFINAITQPFLLGSKHFCLCIFFQYNMLHKFLHFSIPLLPRVSSSLLGPLFFSASST